MKINHSRTIGIGLAFVDAGYGGADYRRVHGWQIRPFPGRKSEIKEQALLVFPGNTPRRPADLMASPGQIPRCSAAHLAIGAYNENG
jgi:hypothetical protein